MHQNYFNSNGNQVNLDLQNKSKKIGEDVFEVSLELTAKVVNADKTTFIAKSSKLVSL